MGITQLDHAITVQLSGVARLQYLSMHEGHSPQYTLSSLILT